MCDSLTSSVTGPTHVVIESCGGCVTVVTRVPRLAYAVLAVFPGSARESVQRHGGEPMVHVGVDAGRYVLALEHAPTRRYETFLEWLSAVEFAVTELLLASCQPYVPLHASGAVVDGAAVLALGRAGAGKSSLAIAWHRKGHAALGDDAVLAGPEGRVHPFPRLYEVDTSLLDALALPPEQTAFWEAGSTEAWYDPSSGAGWAKPAPVGLIAVAQYRPGAALSVEPLSRRAVLNALLHSMFGAVPDRARAVEPLARMAEGADGYVVTFGAAVDAAAAVADKVRRR